MEARSSPAVDLDLRNYLYVARRRWAVIILVGLLVPAISVLISLRRETRYAASAEVLIRRQNLAASLTPGQVPYTDAQTAERAIETQVQLARVPDLADRVVTSAGLAGIASATDLLEASSVIAKPKSDILVFRVEWPTASEARTLAGSYADQFTTFRRELDTTELEGLASSVRGQLAAIDTPDGRRSPLYEDLQDKLRQIQTLQALQTSSVVVVRRADTASEVGPTPVTMGGGGLLLGLMLGLGLAFLLESLDTHVRRSSEIAAILGIPLLARIPIPPARLLKRRALVVMEEPNSQPAEAFAFLRTNLTFANLDSDAKIVMFCSAVAQEGKSTTIANLAVEVARGGRRVVLVDLDYRRPTIHSFFSLARTPGVTEVLRGTHTLDDALRPVTLSAVNGASAAEADGSADASLRVLPAGGVTHRIDVDAIAALLGSLRKVADVVLVDAPPLLLVGEALALSAKMDALVVVARLNHVRRPMLEEVRRALDGAPVHLIGFVATAAAEDPGYSRYYKSEYAYAAAEEAPPAPPPSAPIAPEPPRLPDPAPVPERPVPAVEVGATTDPQRSRDELLDSVFANGSSQTNGQPEAMVTPGTPGVRPRRSWAQGTAGGPEPVASGSDNGESTDVASPQERIEAEGEGTDV